MAHSLFLSSVNEFAAMRVQNNLAQGIFQQVVILPRLTYRLYSLRGRIEDIKSDLEVHCSFSLFILYHAWPITVSQLAVDSKLLQDAIMESATNTVVLSPTLSPTTGTSLP